MHRFFVAPRCIDGDMVTLSGGVARQLSRVLRSQPGDRITVLDDSGQEYLVTLETVSPRQVLGVVSQRLRSEGEPAVSVTLYQGMLKGERFEFVLQKGTELGVSTFVPILSTRTVRRVRGSGHTEQRHNRWRRIIMEAAEQSRRGRLPVLERPIDFSAACDAVEGPGVIPWELEQATSLKAFLVLRRTSILAGLSVSVLIGPEGGFTESEIDYARTRGLAPVTLGRRTLRAETAGIAAVTSILYELGEMG